MEEPSMIDFLLKLSYLKGVNLLLIGFGTIVAPFWFLFQFYPALISSGDFMKTFILSVAIGTPICLAMSVVNYFILEKPKSADNNQLIEVRFLLMGVSCAFCGFAMYMPCIFKFFKPDLQPREAINLLCYVFGGSLIFSILVFIKRKIKAFKRRKVALDTVNKQKTQS